MSPGPADLVLRNAPIYQRGRWAGDTIAIRGGSIVALGTSEDVRHFTAPTTETRVLDGTWLLPGFHDAPVHPVSGGMEMGQCDLTGVSQIPDYLTAITRYAARHPERPW